MKKSNKLLLVGFLTLPLIFAAIHIALYAKYKAGDYTTYNTEDDLARLSMEQFPNILFVSVRNVAGATVKFSEVAQVEKNEKGDIQFSRKGDTLEITGKTNQQEYRRPITIYLPHNSTLSLQNAALTFESGSKNEIQNNPVIHLQNSHAIFPGEQASLSLGHLRLIATDNSRVMFRANAKVVHLDVKLSNSAIEAAEGSFGQLSIATDSLSRISLSAKQLLKANIGTGTPE
jgi:hypothetical protein